MRMDCVHDLLPSTVCWNTAGDLRWSIPLELGSMALCQIVGTLGGGFEFVPLLITGAVLAFDTVFYSAYMGQEGSGSRVGRS